MTIFPLLIHIADGFAMSSKLCFKCQQIKPISEFYKHRMMADGHLNKCKECTKADVRKHRVEYADYYRAHDKRRANTPQRVAARKQYASTPDGKETHAKANRKWQERFPHKKAASVIVGNAVRDGRLKREPCFICGKRAQAHHPDYERPLDVVWLCQVHHVSAHSLAKECG
jgi:hypothetical protein